MITQPADEPPPFIEARGRTASVRDVLMGRASLYVTPMSVCSDMALTRRFAGTACECRLIGREPRRSSRALLVHKLDSLVYLGFLVSAGTARYAPAMDAKQNATVDNRYRRTHNQLTGLGHSGTHDSSTRTHRTHT